MSEALLAVPVAQMFMPPAPAAVPTDAERRMAAEAAAREAGRSDAESCLLPRIAELEQTLAAERDQHAAALATADQRFADAFAALETALVHAITDLGLAVAQAVLAAEPRLGADTVAALVADALAGLPDSAAGKLRMHPSDISAAPLLPPGWVLSPDPALPPGRVIAEAGPCLSAADLSQRLAQLGERMETGR